MDRTSKLTALLVWIGLLRGTLQRGIGDEENDELSFLSLGAADMEFSRFSRRTGAAAWKG